MDFLGLGNFGANLLFGTGASGPAFEASPQKTLWTQFHEWRLNQSTKTWGTISFEDWRDLVLPSGMQMHWAQFVQLRNAKRAADLPNG